MKRNYPRSARRSSASMARSMASSRAFFCAAGGALKNSAPFLVYRLALHVSASSLAMSAAADLELGSCDSISLPGGGTLVGMILRNNDVDDVSML